MNFTFCSERYDVSSVMACLSALSFSASVVPTVPASNVVAPDIVTLNFVEIVVSSTVPSSDGSMDGYPVGAMVGNRDGARVDAYDGLKEGEPVCSQVGHIVGSDVGGRVVGDRDGTGVVG